MTQPGVPDLEEILAQMRQNFLETAREKLLLLNGMLDTLDSEGQLSAQSREQFSREVHSLKGMGGTFQVEPLTVVCRMLEDILGEEDFQGDGIASCIRLYVERIGQIIDADDPNDASHNWVAGLPDKTCETPTEALQVADVSRDRVLSVLVALTDPDVSNAMAEILSGKGHKVATESSAFAVFEAVVKQTPDVLLLSLDTPEMDALELIRALTAMNLAANLLIYAIDDTGADLPLAPMPPGVSLLSSEACLEKLDQGVI